MKRAEGKDVAALEDLVHVAVESNDPNLLDLYCSRHCRAGKPSPNGCGSRSNVCIKADRRHLAIRLRIVDCAQPT